jgi:flagellar motor switch protein FliN/FliY
MTLTIADQLVETPDRNEKEIEGLDKPSLRDAMLRVPVTVQVVIGTVTLPLAEIVKLSTGAILPLDQPLGEPVMVLVNGRIVAKGELFVQDAKSERLTVTIREVEKGTSQL